MSIEYDPASIVVLQSLEPVRRRPAMYLGDLNSPDLTTNLLFEALRHAIDEVLDKSCSKIVIGSNGRSARVAYDAGMSLEADPMHEDMPAAVAFLTLLHACSNRKKHTHVGSEFCKIGPAVLNAVSSPCAPKSTTAAKRHSSNFVEATG